MNKVFLVILFALGICYQNLIAQNITPPPTGTKEYDEWKHLQVPKELRKNRIGNYDDSTKELESNNLMRTSEVSSSLLLSTMSSSESCPIEDPTSPSESGFIELPANDDGSTGPIVLPFNFQFFGDSYDTVYVNNNGNISFLQPYWTYTPNGFPDQTHNMIAPFWADVDTRGSSSGTVYYKVEDHRFTVIWHQVGYYNSNTDKLNTFKLVITDGTDESIDIGNNVGFFYGDMQWTTGDASGGVNGFGGSPAVVGMNKAIGNNDCFFYQYGLFDKEGTVYYDPNVPAGVSHLDYKCIKKDVSQLYPLELDFEVNQFKCGLFVNPEITNISGCVIDSLKWDFGDGYSSNEYSPIHGYSNYDNYLIGLTVYYTCGECGSSVGNFSKEITLSEHEIIYEDSVLSFESNVRKNILNNESNTFSENWGPELSTINENSEQYFYENSLGNWKPEKILVYDGVRNSTENVVLNSDGTFTMNSFNWDYANWGDQPNWIPVSTITGYTSSGFEMENRDVLGIYNAALYGYDDQLVVATGTNTRYGEMAYTGFESFREYLSGNWQFGPKENGSWLGMKVTVGNQFFAVVDQPISLLSEIDTVTIMARIPSENGYSHFSRQNVQVLCKSPYEANPLYSVLVLDAAPSEGIWNGNLYYNVPQRIGSSYTEMDTTIAHTGSTSLKVEGSKVFEQTVMQLDTGSIYRVSAWMSLGKQQSKPYLGNNVGVEILFADKEGQVVDSLFFQPSGPMIEGWQKVEGLMSFPDSSVTFAVNFSSGVNDHIWVDDLRLLPEHANMKSYVYEKSTYRLSAILDEENFATYYFYDKEGDLVLVKKETTGGLVTITEYLDYEVEEITGPL